MTARNTTANFLLKINYSPGCWEWTGGVNTKGYAVFCFGGKHLKAYRFSFEYFNRILIPKGLQLDHLCRNKSCVNPAHLEVVTNRENTLRGTSFAALNSVKTHCPKNHPYDKENTSINNRGSRECKICHREGSRKHKNKIRTLAAADFLRDALRRDR